VDVLYTFGRTPAWASSNPTGPCKNNPAGSCYPPANIANWTAFVTAITARYAGKIKYWETWNEPNATNLWAGTTAQMLSMAKSAYPIIKASSSAAVVLSPAPQGASAYRWLDAYLAAGGGAYADGFAFHGYVGFTNGVSNPPERIVSLISNMKSVMARYGQGSKPLWDTEHGWGPNTSLPNQDQQAAWLARHIILSWSSGIARSIWYLWDSPDQGTLWDRSNKIHKPGTAYGEVYKWLGGSTLKTPCSMASDSVWTCVFTRPDGQMAEVKWNSSGATSAQTISGQYLQYCDLAGTTYGVPSSQTVMIGPKPTLLLTGSSTGNIPPVAVLAVTPLSGNVPLTITADSSGSAGRSANIVARTIDFGDGTVIAGTAGSHTYHRAGSFVVKLSVKDNLGLIGSASQTVFASSQTIAVAVSPSTVTVKSGNSQQFVATIQNTVSQAFTWSATLGSITSSGLYTAPRVTVNTTVKVTASAIADPTKFATAYVTVTPAVLPPPTLLINPGFELGTIGWAANTGNGATVRVLANATAADRGMKYLEANSGTGHFVAYFAAGPNGRPQYFPVQAGQVITFGGGVYRVSGDGYARWKIQLSDRNKAHISHVSPIPASVTKIGSWAWMQRSYTVPAGKAYFRFELEIYAGTVPTVVRFDDAMLQVK
jgi:hypothetical protein